MVAFIWRGSAPGSTTASIGATASQATGSPSTRSAARAQAGDLPLQSATVTFIWPGRALAAAVQISEALAQTTTSTGRPLIDWKPAGAELLRTLPKRWRIGATGSGTANRQSRCGLHGPDCEATATSLAVRLLFAAPGVLFEE